MQYRTDRKTGNQLSALGFGCMRFPGKRGSIDQEKTTALVRGAVEKGINYFDTAYIYGGSEEALGRALQGGLRDKVYIADKLPIYMCRSKQDFPKYFSQHLQRLSTDRIDYYLIHMLQDLGQWKKLCGFGIEDWLRQLKLQGLAGSVGFSFHGNREQFELLLDAYDWDFCQIQYNYVDEHNQAGRTGLEKASEKGLSVMVMEPLLGGKLATGLPQAAIDVFAAVNPEYSPARWGLRWVWNHSEVTLLLSGMNEQDQLLENIETADMSHPDCLKPEDLEAYAGALEQIRKATRVPCTGCGYCMPCPFGVDIPTCFTAYNSASTIGKRAGFMQYMQTTGGLAARQRYASLCRKCGKCEAHCPQGIPIREKLSEVKKELEPFWFRPGMAAARKFSGTKTEKDGRP